MKFKFLILFFVLLGFGSQALAEKEPTKEERLELITNLENEFEKQISEDKSLSTEEIKEMRDYVEYLKESETWPRTLAEAVEKIITTMPKEDAPVIMKTPRKELSKYHHSWGKRIRNAFGLWKGNPWLTKSVCGEECHPDEVSMKIIEAVWDKLQKQALIKDAEKDSAS